MAISALSLLVSGSVDYLHDGTVGGVVGFRSCSDARRITPAHRQGFASVAAAQLDGYRLCPRRRPTAAVAVLGTLS